MHKAWLPSGCYLDRPLLGLIAALGRAAPVHHTQRGLHQGNFGMVVSGIAPCALTQSGVGSNRLAEGPLSPG